jgi:hypothetical protein
MFDSIRKRAHQVRGLKKTIPSRPETDELSKSLIRSGNRAPDCEGVGNVVPLGYSNENESRHFAQFGEGAGADVAVHF